MDLNKDQFKDHIGPFYHGTDDLDNVIDILTDGFSTHRERNGRTAGQGVYLTSDPQRAQQFGSHVIKAYLRPMDEDSIARAGHHRTFVNDVSSGFWEPHSDRHSDAGDPYDAWLRDNGYRAHEDPDEPSDLIVHNPRDIVPVDYTSKD